MRRLALMFAILMTASHAFAGVTVHFKGKLKDPSLSSEASAAACKAAKAHNWRWISISDPGDPAIDSVTSKMLQEIVGSPNLSTASGAVIYPHEMSEPLYLIFGERGEINNFIKTQFAGPDVHIGVVGVLDAIKPYFAQFDVQDEGRYWETRDRSILQEDMDSVLAQLNAIKAQHKNAVGPVKLEGGRIVDLTAGKR